MVVGTLKIPYSRKIWRELYLAKWPPSGQKLILAEFKFGDWQLRDKFLLRHRTFVRKSTRGLTEASRSHGRVSTRGHHIYKSTSTPLLGEVLECNIESGNVHDRYAVAVQRRKTVVGHGKISAACSLFLQRAGRIRCTVIGVRCFPIYACPLLRRVVIVFASRTSFLLLRGLTFDATLDFSICAFSRSFWVRADDSIARYLPRKCRSILRKVLACTKPFCLYTFRLHFAFVQRLKRHPTKFWLM